MSDLRSRLRTLPLGEEDAARDRTAATLADAFAERTVARPRAHRRLTPLAALAAALGVTAAALAATGQGGAVTRWLGDLVDPPPAVQRLDRLPAPGRLLVVGPHGAALVDADGQRHALGDFDDATWSPHGLFVAAVHGSALTAVAPDGEVHWTLTARAPVHDPRWGPDGFRIAYRAGATLRVVAGDGSGDRLIAAHVAPIAGAWRPGASHALAFVTAGGTLRLARTDAGTSRAVARGLDHPVWIGWTGRSLLAATPRRLGVVHVVLHREGKRERPPYWIAPVGAEITGAAVSPSRARIAVLLRGAGLSRLLVLDARTLRPRRSLTTLAGAATGPVWSPDGRWIAAAQPARARWLLVPLATGSRTRAIGGAAGAARPRGWCCP